jgi:cholecystokinin
VLAPARRVWRAHGWWPTLGRSPQTPSPSVNTPLPLLPTAMNTGVCLCVLMAFLAVRALAQPGSPADPAISEMQRAEEVPRRQLRAVPRTEGESRARLGALLARYIQQARKGKDATSPALLFLPWAPNPDPSRGDNRWQETQATGQRGTVLLS